jgi:hypothetical protein
MKESVVKPAWPLPKCCARLVQISDKLGILNKLLKLSSAFFSHLQTNMDQHFGKHTKGPN